MSNEYSVGSDARKLQEDFWRTRVEAKALYRQLQTAYDRPDWLVKAYTNAWEAYRKADLALFLYEATNE